MRVRLWSLRIPVAAVWTVPALACVFAPGFCGRGQAGETSPAEPASKEAVAPSTQVKRGFQMEVIASAPSVGNPVAMAFDENGRLWVAERFIPPGGIAGSKPGRVRVLDDADDAGVYRASIVVAENVPNPSSIACFNGGVFVAATPDILYLKEDRRGGTNITRQVVFSGFNRSNRVVSVGALLHSLQWGLDNRIYGGTGGWEGDIAGLLSGTNTVSISACDFSFDPWTLRLEPETGVAGSSVAFDDRGRRFASDFDRPLRRPMYEYRHLLHNPYIAWPQPMLDVASPATAVFRLVAPVKGEAQTSSSGSGPGREESSRTEPVWITRAQSAAIYRGNLFPTNYQGNVFIVDSEARVIHRAALRETGLQTVAVRLPEDAQAEFISSTDGSFRPWQIINGPDGALYLADNGKVEGQGRVYRIAPQKVKVPATRPLGKASTYDLVAALAQPNGWHRDTAARLLFERRDPAAIPLLTNMLNSSRVPLARIHAAGALAGLSALTENHVLRMLKDTDERVRYRALELLETPPPGGVSRALAGQLQSLMSERSAQMRRQLAVTLGQVQHQERASLLATILIRDLSDPWMARTVLGASADRAPTLFATLAATPAFRADASGQRFLLDLAGMVGRMAKLEDVTVMIDFLGRAPADRIQVYSWMQALGDGLRIAGASLGKMDVRGHLLPYYTEALNAALNGDVSPAGRAQALRLLAVSPFTYVDIGDWLSALAVSSEPPPVQAAAIETWCRYEEPRIYTDLLQRWPQYSVDVRQFAINTLLLRVERAGPILVGLETGKIKPAEMPPLTFNLLRTHPNTAIARRAEELLGPVPGRRQPIVDQYVPALRLTGSATAGRQVFLQRCASCHAVKDGLSQGFDLAGAKVRGREQLLADVVDPGRRISPADTTQVVVGRNGEMRVGTLETTNPEAIVLRQADGSLFVWPRNTILLAEPRPWSMMPDGLEQGLTAQAMADLLAFLLAR